MQVPGVLQALEVLCFHKKRLDIPFPFGIVEMLAGALASGAAPFLRNLYLGGDRGGMLTDDAVEVLAAMFEARSQCLACRRLEVLQCDGRIAGNCRLMRALLPSVWELDLFYGCEHNHTVPIWAPQLKRLYLDFLDLGAAPSVAVLESMPALEIIILNTEYSFSDQLAVLQPVILALNRRVAFQRLQELSLSHFRLDDAGWDALLSALACAPHLTFLKLGSTELSPTTMFTFSTLLCQNAFAMLQSLRFPFSTCIGDQGVANLVQGLLAPACRTRLTLLDLNSVGMGDEGMAALASAVHGECFERLRKIDIRGNQKVSKQGLGALARAAQATEMHGLHRLLRIRVDGRPAGTCALGQLTASSNFQLIQVAAKVLHEMFVRCCACPPASILARKQKLNDLMVMGTGAARHRRWQTNTLRKLVWNSLRRESSARPML